ncbi:MAG: hypothetical protein IPM16_10265 [Chloroflexi bacterium]|nr:hypothetical protein [Chloroflexota bacterium]
MTNYSTIERDFIKRTLEIIDQYEKLARAVPPPENQYEVTLLLNCLLGLLVYPQQLAGDNHESRFEGWLTSDLFVDVHKEWGLDPEDLISPEYKLNNKRPRTEFAITVDQLTMRNLVRQLRNTIAHARFSDPKREESGHITHVEFKDDDDPERPGGFHLRLPVERLEAFVRKLAASALERLEVR